MTGIDFAGSENHSPEAEMARDGFSTMTEQVLHEAEKSW